MVTPEEPLTAAPELAGFETKLRADGSLAVSLPHRPVQRRAGAGGRPRRRACTIKDLATEDPDLEDVFLSLTYGDPACSRIPTKDLSRARASARKRPRPDPAPVAQLDRALPSEGKGHTFESCRVRQGCRIGSAEWGRRDHLSCCHVRRIGRAAMAGVDVRAAQAVRAAVRSKVSFQNTVTRVMNMPGAAAGRSWSQGSGTESSSPQS